MAFLRSLVLVLVAAFAVVDQMVEAQTATDPNGIRVYGYRILFSLKCSRYSSNSILDPLIVPGFPDADVECRCGENYDMVIGSTTTDVAGFGQLLIYPEDALPILPVESNCKLVVTTSLSTCNPDLPSTGRLESSIKYYFTEYFGRPIAEYGANNFQYNPNLN